MPMHLAPNKTAPVHRSRQVSQMLSAKLLCILVEGAMWPKESFPE